MSELSGHTYMFFCGVDSAFSRFPFYITIYAFGLLLQEQTQSLNEDTV